MKVKVPSLAPILRSSAQGRILATLMADPSRSWTLSELAFKVDVDPATVSREIARAVAAGIVADRRVGRARLVRADTAAPHYRALAEIVLAAFGPPVVIIEEFDGVEGVDALILFGSWAARASGLDGPSPGDIDVLVLGEPLRGEVREAAHRAELRLGLEVNATIRSVAEWTSDDPFLRELRRRPLVVLAANENPQLQDLRDRMGAPQ